MSMSDTFRGEPAATLLGRLVQPCGCKPVGKKAVPPQKQWSTGSDGNDEKDEKNLLRRRSVD
jgi:hypothetical protein